MGTSQIGKVHTCAQDNGEPHLKVLENCNALESMEKCFHFLGAVPSYKKDFTTFSIDEGPRVMLRFVQNDDSQMRTEMRFALQMHDRIGT